MRTSFAESSDFYSMLGVSLGRNKINVVPVFSTIQDVLVLKSSVGSKQNAVLEREKFLIKA